MKACYLLTALTMSVALSACQGANPFQGSDPLKNYGSVRSYSTPVNPELYRPQISLDETTWPDSVSYPLAASFKIQVYDYESNINEPPILDERASFHQDLMDAGELDGSLAVTDCKPDAKFSLGSGVWQFDCSFDTKALTGVDSLLKTDKTVNFAFDLSAQSKVSGMRVKTPLKMSMKVVFPKKAPAPAKTDAANTTTNTALDGVQK